MVCPGGSPPNSSGAFDSDMCHDRPSNRGCGASLRPHEASQAARSALEMGGGEGGGGICGWVFACIARESEVE